MNRQRNERNFSGNGRKLNGIFPGFLRDENLGISGFVRDKSPIFYPDKSQNHGIFNPAKISSLRLKHLEILVDFLEAFFAIFRNIPCQKKPGACVNAHAQHKFSSRALQKHRVRKNNFFHIFARTVLKTSFSALNWVVAVRTRG